VFTLIQKNMVSPYLRVRLALQFYKLKVQF